MSEYITAENIDLVIKKNCEIRDEVIGQVTEMRHQLQSESNITKITSMSQLALHVLNGFGLIQVPLDDKFWSGAIYVKNGKTIPVINTALPRANQYFAAWHEIYHLMYDKVSFNHVIENDTTLEERKAEFFAANMLLDGIDEYYKGLPEMDFYSKVFYCMSVFQAPYKAVLIFLYEYADQSNNEELKRKIKEVFDCQPENMSECFCNLGLDDSLVIPSNVVNITYLQTMVHQTQKENQELTYHKDNEAFLDDIREKIIANSRKNK